MICEFSIEDTVRLKSTNEASRLDLDAVDAVLEGLKVKWVLAEKVFVNDAFVTIPKVN